MMLFKNIYLSIELAYDYTKALNMTAKNKYDKALSILSKWEGNVEDAEVNLLFGLLYYRKEKIDDSINNIKKSIKNINNSGCYNVDEKKYLMYYANMLLMHIGCIESSVMCIIDYDIRKDWDIDNVRKALRHNFPID